jgi:hypothetical protein
MYIIVLEEYVWSIAAVVNEVWNQSKLKSDSTCTDTVTHCGYSSM